MQEQTNLRWEPIVFENWLHGGQPQGQHWMQRMVHPAWLALPSQWMCEHHIDRSKTHSHPVHVYTCVPSRLIDFFIPGFVSFFSLPPPSPLHLSILHLHLFFIIRKRLIPWTQILSCCEEPTRLSSLLPLPPPHPRWPSRHQDTVIITDMDMGTPAQVTLTHTILAMPLQDTFSISINISLI